jgi:hypothetical protein
MENSAGRSTAKILLHAGEVTTMLVSEMIAEEAALLRTHTMGWERWTEFRLARGVKHEQRLLTLWIVPYAHCNVAPGLKCAPDSLGFWNALKVCVRQDSQQIGQRPFERPAHVGIARSRVGQLVQKCSRET